MYKSDSIKVESCNVTMSQLIEKAQLQVKILSVLKEVNGLAEFSELLKMTGAKVDSLKVTLNKMKNKGELVNPSRGLWGLATKVNVNVND